MRKGIKGSICIILGALFSICAAACGNENGIVPPIVDDSQRPALDGAKTLVVYFSQPDNVDNSTVVIEGETLGNTQYMAYVIQENTGANIFRILPETPYPTDHEELVDLAQNEQREKARPKFQGEIENFEEYSTVFVGYPNWWGDMPMILYTFFETYDFSGKTIIPFNTHGGSGFSDTISTIRNLEPNATVREGKSISRNNIQNAEQEIIDWVKSLGLENSNPPEGQETAEESEFHLAKPTPGTAQIIELWEEGKIPAWRSVNNNDPSDFRPTLEYFPAASGLVIKGAVILCAGGAFAFRGNFSDTYPTANRLTALGYQCFVVQYRLRPFTQEESALDLARAVRYVRYYADEFGFDEKDIAIVGYSAGGILCGEHALNWKGAVSPTLVDGNYVPDALDQTNADVAAVGHIYSFYGRLSVSNNDVATLKAGNLPPTFYAYGTEDPFYSQFNQNVAAVKEAGVKVESHVYQGQPHGFGAGNENSNWIPDFDKFLSAIFEEN